MLPHKVRQACPRSGHAARAHVRTHFLYLGNYQADEAEIWYPGQYNIAVCAKHVKY